MAAARTDSRGSMVSARSGAGVVHIVGLPELDRALKELAAMGAAEMTAAIGTDLIDPPYPFFLEYGTSRMPAYPSARPAFDEMKDVTVQTTADVMGQLIVGGSRDGRMVMSTSLREGARPIENRWKELARYKTGAYRQSIHTEVVDGTS